MKRWTQLYFKSLLVNWLTSWSYHPLQRPWIKDMAWLKTWLKGPFEPTSGASRTTVVQGSPSIYRLRATTVGCLNTEKARDTPKRTTMCPEKQLFFSYTMPMAQGTLYHRIISRVMFCTVDLWITLPQSILFPFPFILISGRGKMVNVQYRVKKKKKFRSCALEKKTEFW